MKSEKQNNFLLQIFFAICVVVTLGGCAANNIRYPSITDTETKTYNYGHVVWRDLITPDPKKAADFYSKVFGWQVQDYSQDDQQYWVFKNNGKPVAGMFLMSDARTPEGGEWVGSISVPSVDNSSNISKTNGGSIMIEPIQMNGRGKVALISDPQKAVFGLIHSSKGDPPAGEPVINEWLWAENWANNPDQSAKFYKTLLNAQSEEKLDDERKYTVIINEGKKTEGIIKNPIENVRSHWMQYIRVIDVNETTQKAKDAGAKILLEPDSTIRGGTVAIIMDPTGAPFAIQKWPIK